MGTMENTMEPSSFITVLEVQHFFQFQSCRYVLLLVTAAAGSVRNILRTRCKMREKKFSGSFFLKENNVVTLLLSELREFTTCPFRRSEGQRSREKRILSRAQEFIGPLNPFLR
jgi:hypothetical protein